MSGYPLKTSYDATQKRKKYLEELSLRARLDNENLQANKLYKRTGAISTLPDTRTTTEKLADLYKLRIEIRSKLGQLMSGDDAQKVVNRLDAQELVFLVGRIDRYITELKPKYSMGMPYQIFIKYFKDAISNFMAYGDIDLNTAAVFENVARTEELKNAIDEMVREIQLAGKKELILKIEGLDDFYNTINQAKMILPNVADPTLQQNIENSLLAIENIPTAIELDDLKNRYEQAVRTGSVVREREIVRELEQKIEAVNQLEAEKEALKQNLEILKQDVAQQAVSQLSGVPTYYGDFIPITNERYFTSGLNGGAIKLFQEIVDVANKEGSDKKLEFEEWVKGHSPLFDRIRNKTSGKPYVDVLNKIGGIASINQFIQDNKDFFNDFMEIKEFIIDAGSSTPSTIPSPSGSSSSSQSITASMIPSLPTSSGSSGRSSGSQTPLPTLANLVNLGNLQSPPTPPLSQMSSMVSLGDDVDDKMEKLNEEFNDKGYDFELLLSGASRGDKGLADVDTLREGIIDVIKDVDIIDVPVFADKVQNFLEDLIKGNWDTSRGGFDAYFKFNRKKITPKSSRPPSAKSSAKSSPKTSRPASPPYAPTYDYINDLGNFKNIEKYREMIIKEFERTSTPTDYLANIQNLFSGVNKVIMNEVDGLDFMINSYMDKNLSSFQTAEEIGDFINSYLKQVYIDIQKRKIPPTIEEFGNRKKSGKGMKRMKGGSVRIDINAGMRDDTNVPKYVPFGRYIINRNKLNDSVIMIKRPNGAFMGDLQSRRVSNNLRNIFEKVVGGNIPNYQDFAKLDEDEKQYLHYVSKKANLVDKLNVPTPNKDEEERMINRYEILRGQLVAGNDNKQMIAEFKKLLLDMSDRKLLPRRQVSDILIDIEKMYG
jgi:hypothetical protein